MQLYPILVDCYGNVIDGEHRLEVDKEWRRTTLDNIKTERNRLVARIVANNVRRDVSLKEKEQLLQKLSQILVDEGVQPGQIAYKVAEVTVMSYRWVTKYLPIEFKDGLQSERASMHVGAHHAAVTPLEECLKPPKRNSSIVIKSYVNADFVSLAIEKRFYEDFEGNSLAFGLPT